MNVPPLTDELRRRIREVARAWLPTPFVPYARIRGVGADCVNLPAGILVEAGVCDRIDLPKYTVSGRGSTSSSPVEDRVVMRTGGKATALTFWLGGGCQTGRLSRSMAATGLCPLAGNELLNLRRGR